MLERIAFPSSPPSAFYSFIVSPHPHLQRLRWKMAWTFILRAPWFLNQQEIRGHFRSPLRQGGLLGIWRNFYSAKKIMWLIIATWYITCKTFPHPTKIFLFCSACSICPRAWRIETRSSKGEELIIHIMKNSRLFILYGASKGWYFEWKKDIIREMKEEKKIYYIWILNF